MAKGNEYVAQWLLQGHRGKDVQAGEVVRMSDEDAAPLLACGVLKLASDQEAPAAEDFTEAEAQPDPAPEAQA